MSSLEQVRGDRSFDEKLADAFRAGLDLAPDADVTSLEFGQHRNWDSLGHMSLIVTLEEAFGVSLAEDGVLQIDSYDAAARILRSQLNAAS